MRFRFALFIVMALLLVSAKTGYGCSCAFGGVSVCQEYWEASAVFVGTVIESRIVSVKEGNYERQMRLVRFSIVSPFRGVEGSEVEVLTGLGGGDCGFGFAQARQYLVYAYAS